MLNDKALCTALLLTGIGLGLIGSVFLTYESDLRYSQEVKIDEGIPAPCKLTTKTLLKKNA